MPNITRGGRMTGLVMYLVGPGRANEHTDQHLVAGDPALMAWHGDDELNRDAAFAIARHLEAPSTVFGTKVEAGLWKWDAEAGKRVKVGYGDAHVWHCSLSLRAEEGLKTDEQWAAIASDFIDRMGFGDEEGTKAACRWAAVRHGVSKAGNDHVHLVVNLVREDGTKAVVHRDFARAQTVARELERVHGLQELDTSRPMIGAKPGEREADARRRARAQYERNRDKDAPVWHTLDAGTRRSLTEAQLRVDEPRAALARKVRACATAAQSENEFVRRARRAGLIVRPRYAAGREDVVTGYSVAERPTAGEAPVWYGGGNLAHDLTLPKLRSTWPDTPEDAQLAVAEWNAARRGQRPVIAGPETMEPDPAMWEQYSAQLAAVREQLASVPFGDRDTWEHVARQAAGTFASWSLRTEPTPGPLAAAADSLARSSHSRRRPTPRRDTQDAATAAFTGAALLLAQASTGGRGRGAQMLMLRQLTALAGAIFDAHRAAGELRRATELRAHVGTAVADVRARLQPVGAPAAAPVPQPAPEHTAPRTATPGSPVPTHLQPARPRTPAPHTPPGIER